MGTGLINLNNDPNLLKFIQEAPTMVAARVMTGLQSTSSSHAMNYLLTEVQKDIWENIEDAEGRKGGRGGPAAQALGRPRWLFLRPF